MGRLNDESEGREMNSTTKKDILRVFFWSTDDNNFYEGIPAEKQDGICVTFDGETGRIKLVESLIEE